MSFKKNKVKSKLHPSHNYVWICASFPSLAQRHQTSSRCMLYARHELCAAYKDRAASPLVDAAL